jgi:hypothetical protein
LCHTQASPEINIQSIRDYMVATGTVKSGWDICKDFPCLRLPFPEITFKFKSEHECVPITIVASGNTEGTMFSALQYEGHKIGGVLVRIDALGSPLEDGISLVWSKHASGGLERHEVALKAVCLTAMLAVSFMHVKGSKLVDPEFATRQLRRQHERSGDVFKVIQIEPVDRIVSEYRDSLGKAEIDQRLHAVRGHFKDCRKHGVAGNPKAKGIYWWQPALRGSREKGTVSKMYETGDLATAASASPAT